MNTPEVPLFSECVVGYRKWNLADWVLTPLNFGSPWRPGVNKAVCQPATTRFGYAHMGVPHDHAPADNCHCGLNAFFEPKGIREGGDVLGAVVAWGDLRVHPDGFRAEYAQIVALVQEGPDLNDVAALYQVPVVPTVEALQMEASKHGSPLPESLRPAEQEEYEDYSGGYAAGGLTLYGTTTTTTYSQALKSAWMNPPSLYVNPFSAAKQAQYQKKQHAEALKTLRNLQKSVYGTPPSHSERLDEMMKHKDVALIKARKKYTEPFKKTKARKN